MLLSNSNIKRVCFSKTSGIIDVELPNEVTLLTNAFENCSQLNTLSGNNIYISARAFYNCNNFTFNDKNGEKVKIKVSSTITDINRAFSSCGVTWDIVKYIIGIIP